MVHKFSDEQFQQIQSALNAAIGMALRFDQSMIGKMSAASSLMDDVANEEGEFKPFSTYPEDREKLLSLAAYILEPHHPSDDKAVELADLVKAILTDEQAVLDAEMIDQMTEDFMSDDIEQGWQNFKSAIPVAVVINDNQPGKTAIIEILTDPPTLEIGTKLFVAPVIVTRS